MSYFITLSFDLKDASSEDYKCVRDELAKIEMYNFVLKSSGGDIDLPENTFAGEFEAVSGAAIKDDIAEKVEQVFKTCGVKGKIFVIAGTGWAWGGRTIK